MADITISIPLNDALVCDFRVAEIGDAIDLYLDAVKFPTADPNPVRGAIVDVRNPVAGVDPEEASSVLDVELDEADLPAGMATLECCDIDRVRCVDCCVQHDERITVIENEYVQFIQEALVATVLAGTPSSLSENLSDDNVTLANALDAGFLVWEPDTGTWITLSYLDTHDATGNVAPTNTGTESRFWIITGAGTFGGFAWNISDVAYYDKLNGVWQRIGLQGLWDAEAVTISGNQTITGDKEFSGSFDVTGATATLNPTAGTLGGVWDATGATIDFGAGPIKVDEINESTGAAGLALNGALLVESGLFTTGVDIVPASGGGANLGSTSLNWANLFASNAAVSTLSELSSGGGIAALSNLKTLLKTVNTTSDTLASDDQVVVVDDDTAGGVVTITLPALAAAQGFEYTVKKLGTTANVVVDANGAETVDGAANVTLTAQYQVARVKAGVTEWHVI